MTTDRTHPTGEAVGPRLELPVGRLEPERAGFLEQIERARREVAQWPEWMRQESAAPAWMLGWDD